jgi:tetratricopeptide (TPR) repeat protein
MPNPVERRLLYLCDHWSRFTADPSKRLLVWRVQDNAVRIVECFFEIQKHQTDYTTGDLFVVFDAAFENSVQYSRALKEALAGQYEASRADLEREGIQADWSFDPAAVPHSARGFVDSLRSFGSRHHRHIGRLVAVLIPKGIQPEAHAAFTGWLERALSAQLPERLRIAVVDSTEVPRLESLIEADHPQVHVDSPEIDGLETAQETFAQEAAVGPAAVFRNLLMGLVTLVEKAPADKVALKAGDALAFARKQGWSDQEVVIGVLVAGSLLKDRRFDEAIASYASARDAAQKTVVSGHPAGRQLVLQTWFGEAGAHLAAGDSQRAADCYREAALLAHAIPNLVLAIEALRMEAFCRARAGKRDEAIETGHAAMRVGARLKADARPMTTLPIAAVDLMRVLDPERVALIADVKSRLACREIEAQQSAERRAEELEGVDDPAAFDGIEDQRASDMHVAAQEAESELQAIIDGADPGFAEVFDNGRELLGTEWPLAHVIAVAREAAAQAS